MSGLILDPTFTGPPTTGHGGIFSGMVIRLAHESGLANANSVTLYSPPPIGRELEWVIHNGRLHVLDGNEILATASAGSLPPADWDDAGPPTAMTTDEAATAPGQHPYPTCFVCGPQHPGGMRLRPSRYTTRRGIPATRCHWQPSPRLAGPRADVVSEHFVWGALDCPGGWTMNLSERPAVLARMSAVVHAAVRVGDTVTIEALLAVETDHQLIAVARLRAESGAILAESRSLWCWLD